MIGESNLQWFYDLYVALVDGFSSIFVGSRFTFGFLMVIYLVLITRILKKHVF